MPNGNGVTARAHLRVLAAGPRFSGSVEAVAARDYCKDVLRRCGYVVASQPFEYSAAVGSYGTPLVGAISLIFIGGMAALSLGDHPLDALVVFLAFAALLVFGGRWLARDAVLTLPITRRAGVNLEARRGREQPAVWLVAHLDSKSQPVPLALRAAGIMLLGLAWSAALVLAVDGWIRHAPARGWAAILIASVVGVLPVIGSTVGTRSAGAVDNASGVATVLRAAELLEHNAHVGVLITDAEELGLAGARAWCAGQPIGCALNCDGVDDVGPLTLMWTRQRAPRLEGALARAARRCGERLRVIPLVPGVLVDGLAFSDAGWEAITLSRGSLATLRRIHTRNDDLNHLRGDGIENAARTLAHAAAALTERR